MTSIDIVQKHQEEEEEGVAGLALLPPRAARRRSVSAPSSPRLLREEEVKRSAPSSPIAGIDSVNTTRTHTLVISGKTLGSCLARFTSEGGEADCLLFGVVESREKTRMSDNDTKDVIVTVSAVIEQLVLLEDGALSDGDGRPHMDTIQRYKDLHKEQALLGWGRVRFHTPSQPSVRECAVHSALTAIHSDTPCFYMGLFTASINAETHIISYEYQFFRGKDLTSTRAVVSNLCASAKDEYAAFHPVRKIVSKTLLDSSVQAVTQQVVLLENMFTEQCNRLDNLSATYIENMGTIQQLELELEGLQ